MLFLRASHANPAFSSLLDQDRQGSKDCFLPAELTSCSPASMSPGPNEADPEVPRMDPAILIFLLYLMILHELVSGWMEYQKQATKPKKQAGPLWSSSTSRMRHSGYSHPLSHPARRDRYRDWRKPGRILRKV